MVTLSPEGLRSLGIKIFMAQGASDIDAKLLSDTLVEANLTGHDSHGVHYFIHYTDRIRNGWIKPKAQPEIFEETESHAVLDGKWAFGQVTAKKAIDLCIEKAKKNIVAAVGAKRCNHIGRVGYYTQYAARKGMIAIIFVNVNHPIASVYNGLDRRFGTNPFSLSVPTNNDTPYLLDYATSVVAHGKASIARAKDEKIPKSWARDRYGRVTEDPEVLWDGGWLLPFGGYKGYALQLAMELLGGILTGSFTGFDEDIEHPSTNGLLTICIDPDGFIGLDAFKEKTEGMFKYIKSTEPTNGNNILIPGEPEKLSKEKLLSEGIKLPEDTWRQIIDLASELDIDPSIALKR